MASSREKMADTRSGKLVALPTRARSNFTRSAGSLSTLFLTDGGRGERRKESASRVVAPTAHPTGRQECVLDTA
jgi:hypothetical protein